MPRNRRFWCWPRNPTSRVVALQSRLYKHGAAGQESLHRHGSTETAPQARLYRCGPAGTRKATDSGAATSTPKSGVARQSIRRIEVESGAQELSDASCIISPTSQIGRRDLNEPLSTRSVRGKYAESSVSGAGFKLAK